MLIYHHINIQSLTKSLMIDMDYQTVFLSFAEDSGALLSDTYVSVWKKQPKLF